MDQVTTLGLTYQTGFGNGFETEALPGALPVGRNSPQRCAYGLYAEQISGSPFTAPRASNQRSWLYRIRPTVAHWGGFQPIDAGLWRTAPCTELAIPPAPLRWDPIPLPDRPLTFIQGIHTITTAGDAELPGRHGRAYLPRHALHDRRILLQCRRRDAVRPAAGRAAPAHRIRRDRHRRPARSPSSRAASSSASTCPPAPPAATCARTTAAASPCPNAARSAPTAWPTRATS